MFKYQEIVIYILKENTQSRVANILLNNLVTHVREIGWSGRWKLGCMMIILTFWQQYLCSSSFFSLYSIFFGSNIFLPDVKVTHVNVGRRLQFETFQAKHCFWKKKINSALDSSQAQGNSNSHTVLKGVDYIFELCDIGWQLNTQNKIF